MPSASQTGIEIRLGFFPLAFFLFACTPQIEIDETIHKKCWGTHFFPLIAGKHKIKIYFSYLTMPQCGANSVDVIVRDGDITPIRYYMWPWMFAKGSLRIGQRFDGK